MTEPVIEARGLARTFSTKRGPLQALAGVDIALTQGEMVLLRGASGSGKTTLLLALGGLSRPTEGRVFWSGRDLYAASRRVRRNLRRCHVGFVFQTMHLLPYLDSEANVALGGADAGLLSELGLDGRQHHRPAQLSAGERQRVALARALAQKPDVILADEPTGNLDPQSAELVAGALSRFHRSGGTVLLATHAIHLALEPDRELRLDAGRMI